MCFSMGTFLQGIVSMLEPEYGLISEQDDISVHDAVTHSKLSSTSYWVEFGIILQSSITRFRAWLGNKGSVKAGTQTVGI